MAKWVKKKPQKPAVWGAGMLAPGWGGVDPWFGAEGDWRSPWDFETDMNPPGALSTTGRIPDNFIRRNMMEIGDYGPYVGPRSRHGLDTIDATPGKIEIPDPDNPGETKYVPTIPDYLRQESIDKRKEQMEGWNTRLHGGADQTTTASGSKPATGFLANIFNDDAFTEAMRDQMAEMGADYDKADQPFKSLADTNVGTAFTRHKPVAAPSMLTTRGIPTGGSYNPYLGDPAKRKPRPR